MIRYIFIIIGVAIFGLQHSGLSHLTVKERIIDRYGKTGYGRLFTFTSIIAISFAFLLMDFWDWFYFLSQPSLIRIELFLPGVILIITGLVLSLIASRVISVSTVADMRTDRQAELITDGIYSRIRHPLYLATILLLFGLALVYPFMPVVVFSLSLVGYVILGTYLEERKLIRHYGDDYLEYMKKAGFLLPKL